MRFLIRAVFGANRVPGAGPRIYGGRILKQHRATGGYLTVMIYSADQVERRAVHKLVAEAFLGPCPPGQQVRHLDGNNQNNAATNLTYGTKRENELDKMRHGTLTHGERNGAAKLTWATVDEIRRRYAAGESQVTIALDYAAVHPGTIGKVVRGERWTTRP